MRMSLGQSAAICLSGSRSDWQSVARRGAPVEDAPEAGVGGRLAVRTFCVEADEGVLASQEHAVLIHRQLIEMYGFRRKKCGEMPAAAARGTRWARIGLRTYVGRLYIYTYT
jgi:hypothetical protein